MASVGHTEVHGVGPKRGVLEGSSDGGIIKESLLFHHGKLVVTTNSKVRGSQTNNRVIGDVGELVNDQSGSSHFLGPVIYRGLSPEGLDVIVGDGVSGDFVTKIVNVLNSRVVGVLVGNKEGRLDITTIGILPLPVEDLVVQVNVVVVDGVIEGDHDHLRNILAAGSSGSDIAKFSRNLGTILRAEAVGQLTDGSITRRSSVGIGFNVASVLIGAVIALFLTVAEETAFDAVSVSASEMVLLTNRLVGEEQRLDLLLLGLGFAVLDGGLPVASLLLDVEGQAGGATDGLETRGGTLNDVSAFVFSRL